MLTYGVSYGVSPIDFCLSVIVPIPKHKRIDKCDSSNYRAIAISSLLSCISTKKKDWYSPFYNINKYIDTYVINNCISSLHSGLAIKE